MIEQARKREREKERERIEGGEKKRRGEKAPPLETIVRCSEEAATLVKEKIGDTRRRSRGITERNQEKNRKDPWGSASFMKSFISLDFDENWFPQDGRQ